MCGIAGYFNIYGESPDQSVLERMIVALKHRGPDGCGFYVGDGVGLGHARLSIIDLSAGWQPLSNEDNTLWISFNGEIFNYPELRRELIRKGHVFSTQTDTEVILHLFEEKGLNCLEDLNGQFSLAIYDKNNKQLFLARDRMGIRPLFYTQHNGNFYFASEVKAIFNGVPSVPRSFDHRAISNIFTFWSPALEETVFQSVRQLPAGHCLHVDSSGIHNPRQYWEIPFSPDDPGSAAELDYIEGLREILIDSIRLRLRADVPVGAYLSGGLDSSAVTSLVKHFTSNPLKTFSISFTDKVYDEREEQEEMVRYLDTDHHQIFCSYEDIAAVFPKIIWHTEVPILRTAPSPLYMLSGLVRDHGYKVVLTGEGADEILGGYDIFKEAKIRAFINKNQKSSLRPLLLKRLYPYLAFSPTRSVDYARRFFESDASPEDLFYAHRPRWKTTSQTHVFFRQDIIRDLPPPEERLSSLVNSLRGMSPFLRAQFLESKMLLGNYLLSSQGDRMAMAHSVEGRFPFLDHRLVEYAGKIPATLKMKVLNEKNILKKAVRDILPRHIVQRKKQPYMAPDIFSFFGKNQPAYLDYYLSSAQLDDAEIFNTEAVFRLLAKCEKKHRQGFRENMAFIGILSTQIVYDTFINNFPFESPRQLPPVMVMVNDL